MPEVGEIGRDDSFPWLFTLTPSKVEGYGVSVGCVATIERRRQKATAVPSSHGCSDGDDPRDSLLPPLGSGLLAEHLWWRYESSLASQMLEADSHVKPW